MDFSGGSTSEQIATEKIPSEMHSNAFNSSINMLQKVLKNPTRGTRIFSQWIYRGKKSQMHPMAPNFMSKCRAYSKD